MMKHWVFLYFWVLTIFPFALFSSAKWKELAEKDLARVYEAIKDNHPGSIYDESFRAQLERGLEVATHKIDQVSSYEGIYFLLSEFTTSFQDHHVRIEETYQHKSFKDPEALFAHQKIVRPDKKHIENWKYEDSSPLRWPCFNVKRGKSGELIILNGPFSGSKIVAIDGIATEQFLSKYIYPFYGVIPSLEASKIHASLMAFFDFGNPFCPVPKSCVIEDFQGDRQEITLSWEQKGLGEILRSLNKQQKRDLFLKELREDILWLRIPSFLIGGGDIDLFHQIISEVHQCQNKKNLVIDLRGNGGGSSEWGRKLLLALAPDLPSLREEDYGVKWRVSQDILSHIKRSLSRIASSLGSKSRIYQEFSLSAQLMEERIKSGDYSLLDQPIITSGASRSNSSRDNPAFRKIFLLTDAGCGSATLIFMDHALQLPNSIHIGQTTGADSIYHDIMLISLPSQLFHVTIPMKVWTKGPRANNQPYTPSLPFYGDISSDEEVEAWVLEMINEKAI